MSRRSSGQVAKNNEVSIKMTMYPTLHQTLFLEISKKIYADWWQEFADWEVKTREVQVQETCTICMEDVSTADAGRGPNCHHWFHVQCLTDWIKEMV